MIPLHPFQLMICATALSVSISLCRCWMARQVTYVNLDNAASTPALIDAMEAVQRFMPYYASVHRGTGFKSRLSTVAYDQAHRSSAALSARTCARTR